MTLLARRNLRLSLKVHATKSMKAAKQPHIPRHNELASFWAAERGCGRVVRPRLIKQHRGRLLSRNSGQGSCPTTNQFLIRVPGLNDFRQKIVVPLLKEFMGSGPLSEPKDELQSTGSSGRQRYIASGNSLPRENIGSCCCAQDDDHEVHRPIGRLQKPASSRMVERVLQRGESDIGWIIHHLLGSTGLLGLGGGGSRGPKCRSSVSGPGPGRGTSRGDGCGCGRFFSSDILVGPLSVLKGSNQPFFSPVGRFEEGGGGGGSRGPNILVCWDWTAIRPSRPFTSVFFSAISGSSVDLGNRCAPARCPGPAHPNVTRGLQNGRLDSRVERRAFWQLPLVLFGGGA